MYYPGEGQQSTSVPQANMDNGKKLVVLCIPLSGMGHINATIGIATILKNRGHTVVVATEHSWAGKMKAYGFEEEIYHESDMDRSQEAGEQWSKLAVQFANSFLLETIEQLEHSVKGFPYALSKIKYSNKRIAQIIAKRRPNLIIQDHFICCPAIAVAGVPVVFLYSANPLKVLEDENLPPGNSGYGLNDDPKKWSEYRQRCDELFRDTWRNFNDWVVSQGAPSLQFPKTQYTSASLNLYMYPKSLASMYLKRRRSPSLWIGIDHCLKPVSTEFEVPEKLRNLPGKLIFVSLGSTGSAIVQFMKQIVDTLSKCEHKFIVCRGHNHREYSLADNMWGEPFLPQTAILPHVDLVITHGGNNSFIETLYFGKRMIVIPLLCDQYDNAQMAEAAEIGIKFCLGTEPMENLPKKIERALNDQKMLLNVQNISSELQASQSLDEVAALVEEAGLNPQIPTIVEAI